MAQEDACGRTEYGYNARNKRALVRDGEGNETRWMYDGMGRLLALYLPKAWKEQHGEYSYSYDFLDRLIHTKNPDGGHERLMRDGEGNVLKRVHPNAYDSCRDDGEGTTYDYDSDGNNIRIHYPDGGCERIFYDSEGNRIRHVMPESYDPQTDDGEGFTYTYDACSRLTGVTGPDGVRQASYTYDPAGNLTEETDAEGRCTFRSYTAFGELKEQLKPALEKDGVMLYERITWQYDRCGNVLLEQRHGGYWDKNGVLVKEDGAGLALRFTYDSRNRRIRVEDGLGAVISYRYDVQGKLVYEEKAVSKEVRQVIHYGYDRAGRLTERKEELDSGLAPLEGEPRYAVTCYRYDGNGNRTGIVTPEGYRILRSYDTCDRLVAERVVDDKNGIDRTTSVTYDYAGNITRIVRSGKGLGEWEQGYGYDLKDRIVHVKDCLGPVFSYEYDKNDRRIVEILPQTGMTENGKSGHLKNQNRYGYDVYGRLLTRTDASGTVQEENRYLPDGRLALSKEADGQEIRYAYGAHGREEETGTARSRKAGRAAQKYRYDSRGRITGVVNGNGNETGYDLDAWGRIRKIRQADGGEEGYTYDFAGNITGTRDANGGVITYRYNSQGKVCEITDQEGDSETFRYDREGRMVLHVDRNGNEVRTTYNVDGNPVLETGTDRNGENRVTRKWEYDASGNVRKAVAGGFCYTYEYRPDGKLLKKSASGRTLVSCTYFSDGSLESLTDASGKPVFYEYDWRGNLSGMRDENGNMLAAYAHTPGGKLKEIRHSNGIRTGYEYDTDGNLVHLHMEHTDGEILADLYYSHDLNGNRTLKSGSRIGGEGKATEHKVSYVYDRMDRLVSETRQGEETAYVYDLCGNRLKKLDKSGTEEYHYNRKNQLICRFSEKDKTAYRYDKQGNLLEAAGAEGTEVFSYNAFQQQTTVTMPNGKHLENQYDAEYLRAGTVENGTVTSFSYHNGELLAESSPEGDTISRYIPGYGVAAGWNREKDGYHYYHLDEQNSTAYITGRGGEIENRYEYDAFGVLKNSMEEFHNRILYTGQQYDQTSGQYYLRARFYNPVIGRFVQEDEYRGDGLNLYAYCKNNPVVYYDPSGYGEEKCDKVGGNDSKSSSNTTRRQAFREAKEAAGIPKSAEYKTHKFVFDGTSENRIVYEFDVCGEKKYIIEHPFDKMGRGNHFHGADDTKGSPFSKGRYNQYPGHFPEDFNGFN